MPSLATFTKYPPLIALLCPVLASCAQTQDGDIHLDEIQVPSEQDETPDTQHVRYTGYPKGTKLLTTSGLNLRASPSTRGKIRAVMPESETVRVVGESVQQGWYNINFDGIVGWASGKYLTLGMTPSDAVREATARALSSWGFSYHWGGGVWDPTSQEPGSCAGSCPNCTHHGEHGADCSGMLAKAWQVPESNAPTTKISHPYTTKQFYRPKERHDWSHIARANVQEGDAMVYRNSKDTAGHIFYVYGMDPWGDYRAIECKSCSEGCLYNVRSAAGYLGIRRKGF